MATIDNDPFYQFAILNVWNRWQQIKDKTKITDSHSEMVATINKWSQKTTCHIFRQDSLTGGQEKLPVHMFMNVYKCIL